MNRDELIAALEKRYPKANFRLSEDFNGVEGGVWTSAEDQDQLHSGLPLFNYYSQDSQQKSYIFGVRTYLHAWLEEQGWYCEFNDPGTVMIWSL